MLVVMIIVLLLGFAVSQMGPALEEARRAKVKGDINSIGTALMMYQANGFYPTSAQGLKALGAKPEGEPRPRSWRVYMKDIPRDPYGNEYVYVQPGTHNTDGYDLFSAGKDAKVGTTDDIGNWKQE